MLFSILIRKIILNNINLCQIIRIRLDLITSHLFFLSINYYNFVTPAYNVVSPAPLCGEKIKPHKTQKTQT